MLTLKMPPAVVMEALHPLESAKTIVPAWDCPGLIGRTSLPAWPAGAGGVQSGVFAVVVEVAEPLDELWLDEVLELELDELELCALGFWFCAYAAIPPEMRTRMAAAVRSCSLPLSTCMNNRRTVHPDSNIIRHIQDRHIQELE